ncbi:hypothetical protein P3W55_13530 [Pseudomonas citronellolis]|uniref:Uncharacterized protein n=1 Tax=Pseudomonas citronellolis TaxID=53408 RepID=A0AAW6P6D5_9PSED|nr:hypothetical protein [Pseudomonas citronellolis]MDF3842732.1 hypothetical protein [Pseudomonas citronellolis]
MTKKTTHAELEASVIRMAAMLKIGVWGPMNLTGPAADLHEEITRLHMDLEEAAAERDGRVARLQA